MGFLSTLENSDSYVGDYESNVTDVNRNVVFQGSVKITTDGIKCYFEANEIPNHNFHDGQVFATNVSKQIGSYQVVQIPAVAA